jgi:hypothetical protein
MPVAQMHKAQAERLVRKPAARRLGFGVTSCSAARQIETAAEVQGNSPGPRHPA